MWDLRKAKRADAGGAAAAAGEEPAALPVLRTWLAHDKDINSVAVSPNDALVATGSADRSVRLWDPSTGGRLPGPSPAPSPFARARRSPPVLSSPLLSSSLRPSECEACDCGVGRPFLRRPLPDIFLGINLDQKFSVHAHEPVMQRRWQIGHRQR